MSNAAVPIIYVVRKLLYLLPKLALSIMNIRYVENRLRSSYEYKKEKHSKSLPILKDIDADIVGELNDRGFAITSLDKIDIPGTAEMYNAGLQLRNRCAGSHADQMRRKSNQTTVPGSDIFDLPAIFRWGAQQRLLDVAEAYLGLPVGYNGVHGFYTKAGGEESGTHIWHRDREDRRMLKIGVYFHDISPNEGPLQILVGDELTEKLASGFSYPTYTHESLQRKIGREISHSDLITVSAPSRAVTLIDTARKFHRGKPVLTGDRFVIYFVYFARRPRHPFYCYGSGLSLEQIDELAKPLTSTQRDCILWRHRLPFMARLLRPDLFRGKF